MTEAICPCGSQHPLSACCGRYHNGDAPPTAEALMRSRYSAFVLGLEDYLLESWHPDTRPTAIDPRAMPTWTGLDICATEAGGPNDDHGKVEFRAHFKHGGKTDLLHETSRFERVDGKWVYVDGGIHRRTRDEARVGRNAPCPCGSGKKHKRCCGR